MSSHRAIPACIVSKVPNTMGTTWVRHCHMRLISTRRLPTSQHETDARSVGFDLPCSGDARIPHHDVVRLHKPIRLMPVPPALEKPTNVPVDDGGDLIVSISVVHVGAIALQSATTWPTVSRPAHTRQVGLTSPCRMPMQDVVLIVPSPKSVVLSSHTSPSVAPGRVAAFS